MTSQKMRAAQIVEVTCRYTLRFSIVSLTSTKFNKPYQLSSQAVPQCGEDELLIQVHAAGFCHSDLQVWEGQFQAKLPMIPSHEPAGKVVQVGTRVEGPWKIGDRVGVLNFKKACGKCVGCRQYIRRNHCTDPRFCQSREMAGFKHDGAFSEYMIADPAVRLSIVDLLSS